MMAERSMLIIYQWALLWIAFWDLRLCCGRRVVGDMAGDGMNFCS
jgi:hypothetical protein